MTLPGFLVEVMLYESVCEGVVWMWWIVEEVVERRTRVFVLFLYRDRGWRE